MLGLSLTSSQDQHPVPADVRYATHLVANQTWGHFMSKLGTEVQQILLIDDDLKVIDEFSKKKKRLAITFPKVIAKRFFWPVYEGNFVF